MSREVHDKFVEIKIHTAKCDNCNKHNTTIIFRCQTCGQQCCTPCWQRKGGDDRHRLNDGDQGFTGVGEVVGRRKRKSVIVHGRRRVRRRTAMTAEDGGDEDDEEENGEGYAEAIATSKGNGQNKNPGETAKNSRQSFGKSTETERIAANCKKNPKQEASLSFLSAAGRLLSPDGPSCSHAPAVSRLLPRPHTRALAGSHRATVSNTAKAHFSSYISPYPSSASDHDGILALLRAAQYIEYDQLPLSSPPWASQRFSAPRDEQDEIEDKEWGQDAQPRSPLFMTEDIDLRTQSEGGAEPWHTQGEDMMLQLDGAQDIFTGIDVDEEETPAGRIPNRRLDMKDESDEETEYEDWSQRIGDVESGPSREADKKPDVERPRSGFPAHHPKRLENAQE